MSWLVKMNTKTVKQLKTLPVQIKKKANALFLDIESKGPVRGDWSNYSKLSDGSHHCHLSYRYVACWRETEKGILVEVYYVGSREKAPY